MSKLRVFALFDDGEDSLTAVIDGVDCVFTRETAQQDVELSKEFDI